MNEYIVSFLHISALKIAFCPSQGPIIFSLWQFLAPGLCNIRVSYSCYVLWFSRSSTPISAFSCRFYFCPKKHALSQPSSRTGMLDTAMKMPLPGKLALSAHLWNYLWRLREAPLILPPIKWLRTGGVISHQEGTTPQTSPASCRIRAPPEESW